eukprot:gnl/Dysnectes_brevis/5640_a8226_319.p1 GENE.gnl/Dysnectes_brevis/5640_a8226_319~~gnl/Dysnectes_brevis/5640_a8226_319.p1  ORF type:complete len:285 (+),score=39.64 gnl/Dysnectes_brevis/5640_a8226_319:32-886(+)
MDIEQRLQSALEVFKSSFEHQQAEHLQLAYDRFRSVFTLFNQIDKKTKKHRSPAPSDVAFSHILKVVLEINRSYPSFFVSLQKYRASINTTYLLTLAAHSDDENCIILLQQHLDVITSSEQRSALLIQMPLTLNMFLSKHLSSKHPKASKAAARISALMLRSGKNLDQLPPLVKSRILEQTITDLWDKAAEADEERRRLRLSRARSQATVLALLGRVERLETRVDALEGGRTALGEVVGNLRREQTRLDGELGSVRLDAARVGRLTERITELEADMKLHTRDHM